MVWLGILACAPGGGTTIRRCLVDRAAKTKKLPFL
jgi:hypothetical protein